MAPKMMDKIYKQ
ncbi:unnamed protein product [Gordionus sp. m RMFG-2023]